MFLDIMGVDWWWVVLGIPVMFAEWRILRWMLERWVIPWLEQFAESTK